VTLKQLVEDVDASAVLRSKLGSQQVAKLRLAAREAEAGAE
jgi:hypothetical protein